MGLDFTTTTQVVSLYTRYSFLFEAESTRPVAEKFQ